MDLYRHLLRLYPKSFRSEYGEEMRRLHHDLRVHRGGSGFRLFTSTVGDVVRSAPKLRLEEGMSRHPGRTRAVVTILLAIALIGLIMLGPVLGVPALILMLVYMRRHAADLGPAGRSPSMWIGLPIFGMALLVIGAIGAVINTGDDWHPLAMLPLAVGFTTLVVTLVLIAIHELAVRVFHRPPLVAGSTRALAAALAGGAIGIVFVAMGEDRGWGLFITIFLTLITLATLSVYALMVRFMRPSGAGAV